MFLNVITYFNKKDYLITVLTLTKQSANFYKCGREMSSVRFFAPERNSDSMACCNISVLFVCHPSSYMYEEYVKFKTPHTSRRFFC